MRNPLNNLIADAGIIDSNLDSKLRVQVKPMLKSVLFGNAAASGQELGGPTKLNMSCAWCASVCPTRMGLPVKSSANTHPIPQRSTDVVYFLSPNKISGGLYHRVTTSAVYALSPPPGPIPNRGTLPWYNLANPKSAIFKTPFLSKSKLAALISLWR